MTIAEYQKLGVSIESLSLQRLRAIDIKTTEEEKVVQDLVNKRLQKVPVPVVINRAGDNTDFKTRDEELEFQKVIDERISSARPEIETQTPVGDPPEPTPPLELKFCQFCEAKGPISHKGDCTRPEKSLKDKIKALKEEKAKLE